MPHPSPRGAIPEVTVNIIAQVGLDQWELGSATVYGPDADFTQLAGCLRGIADETDAQATS